MRNPSQPQQQPPLLSLTCTPLTPCAPAPPWLPQFRRKAFLHWYTGEGMVSPCRACWHSHGWPCLHPSRCCYVCFDSWPGAVGAALR